MPEPDYDYLRVLLRLAGFDVHPDAFVDVYGASTAKCYYGPDARQVEIHGESANRWIAIGSQYDRKHFMILANSCVNHIEAYINLGWKEL